MSNEARKVAAALLLVSASFEIHLRSRRCDITAGSDKSSRPRYFSHHGLASGGCVRFLEGQDLGESSGLVNVPEKVKGRPCKWHF